MNPNLDLIHIIESGADSGASTDSGYINSEDLIRDSFKRVDLKGRGKRHYFSFQDPVFGVEICLEPCLNGMDVGMYNLNQQDLIGLKQCTNLTKGIYKSEGKEKVLSLREMRHETLERSEKCWNVALKIANEKYSSYKNLEKLKKWKIIPDSENPNTTPSSPYPNGIPLTNPQVNWDSTAGTN